MTSLWPPSLTKFSYARWLVADLRFIEHWTVSVCRTWYCFQQEIRRFLCSSSKLPRSFVAEKKGEKTRTNFYRRASELDLWFPTVGPQGRHRGAIWFSRGGKIREWVINSVFFAFSPRDEFKLYFRICFRYFYFILFYNDLNDRNIGEKAFIKIVLYLCIYHFILLIFLFYNFLVISSRYFKCSFVLLFFSFMDGRVLWKLIETLKLTIF